MTVVFEHCEERDWKSLTGSRRSEELDSLVRQMLLSLYHLHYERYLTHGNITPSCFVCDGSKYKLKNWALNFLSENGSLLDSNALFPDDVSDADLFVCCYNSPIEYCIRLGSHLLKGSHIRPGPRPSSQTSGHSLCHSSSSCFLTAVFLKILLTSLA